MGLDDKLQGGRQDQQSILFDIFVDNNSRTSGEESARTSTTTSTTTESSGSSRTVKTRGANSMAIAVGTAATGIGAEIADDGYRKTIRFADHTTVIGESYDGPGEQSLTFLDVYGQSDNDTPQNSVGMDGIAMGNESAESLESIQISDQNDGEDDDASFFSACSGEGSDDEETRIKRQLLWAVGGIGAMAFLGWAGKKIMNRLFNNDEDVDVGGAVITHRADDALTANDVATAAMHGDGGTTAATTGSAAAVVGDGGTTATTLGTTFFAGYSGSATAATFNASASQSQSQIGFAYVGGQGKAATSMSTAHTQVMQNMALNAANNFSVECCCYFVGDDCSNRKCSCYSGGRHFGHNRYYCYDFIRECCWNCKRRHCHY